MPDHQDTITINKHYLLGGMLIVAFVILGWFGYQLNQKVGNLGSSGTPPQNSQVAGTQTNQKSSFLGEKGETVTASSGKIYINQGQVDDGNMHSFNYFSDKSNKSLYFFIVKASDGTYRAAANACEVCFGSKKGFTQQGNLIRCENCRTTYSKDQIALEKGGCNPRPIDKAVAVENGQLVLKVQDVENTADLF